MARLRVQMPAVVEALRKTQQRYKRIFDASLGQRNSKIKIGDYVYTTNHQRSKKLQRKAIGPFIVVDSDESTFVIYVDGLEKRISSDHTTPAPRPDDVKDDTTHPLLDGFDKPRPEHAVHDEYVTDKLVTHRKAGDSYEFKVRGGGTAAPDRRRGQQPAGQKAEQRAGINTAPLLQQQAPSPVAHKRP